LAFLSSLVSAEVSGSTWTKATLSRPSAPASPSVNFTCWQVINSMPGAARSDVEPGIIGAIQDAMVQLETDIGGSMGSFWDAEKRILVSIWTDSGDLFVGAPDDIVVSRRGSAKGVGQRQRIRGG
jgi:hypothetical protein